MSETNLTAMNELCQQIFGQKEIVDSFKNRLDDESKKLEELKAKAIAHLEQAELENFKSSFGTIGIQQRFSVTLPKDEEKRNEFFGFLKDKGIFEQMITVNSQTLNAFWKDEMNVAVEAGNIDFKIPGIEEPKAFKTLSLRKAK